MFGPLEENPRVIQFKVTLGHVWSSGREGT